MGDLLFEGLLLRYVYFICFIHWVGEYVVVVVFEIVNGCFGRWVKFFIYDVGFFLFDSV